jgi:hypothetical protein
MYYVNDKKEAVKINQKIFFRFSKWILNGTTPYKRTDENKALY